MLHRAGPRARQLAKGFRDDAFSYLLFRGGPVFPFFLVNLVPAFAGVHLRSFVAATAIGVIPAVVVFSLAGTGLDSVIAGRQKDSYRQCMASGEDTCRMVFDPSDVLTPQLIAALVGLGLLALIPVVVKRWRAHARAVT